MNLDEMRSRHQPSGPEFSRRFCLGCDDPVGVAWPCETSRLLDLLTPEKMAQAIRIVDGDHSMGAGELADALLAALTRETA